MEPTRRDFLKNTVIAGTGIAVAPRLALAAAPHAGAAPLPAELATQPIAPTSPPQFTRGVGQYPGAPGEFFGPELVLDPAAPYRNLALLRPAFASSSYDYNLAAQLVTDGIAETGLPTWITTVVNGEILPKQDREGFLNHFAASAIELPGANPSVEVHLNGDTAPEIDRLTLFVAVPQYAAPESLQFTVSTSPDGHLWTQAGSATGGQPLPGENYPPDLAHGNHLLRPEIRLHQPSRNRFYRIDLAVAKHGTPPPYPVQFRLGDVRFYRGPNEVKIGGPYHFTSAWKSAGLDQEWVFVDLGHPFAFDNIKLHWIARPAEGQLQTSDDAQTWHHLQPLPVPTESPVDDIRVTGTGRYLRVLLTRPATEHGYILSELEVFGHGGFVAKPHTAPPPATDGRLNLAGGNWKLHRPNPAAPLTGEALSTLGYNDANWLIATVPATTLTSFLNLGAIPDPNFGQNQLHISDSYFYSDFWYRTEFTAPPATRDQVQLLDLDGINWKAELFLNGQQLGRIDGGFHRGRFNVTGKLKPGGPNALAIRVLKNDTPGSCKQKTLENTGKNGGALGADNPTFHASIGWDWIPTIRGRNTGIWGDIHLTTTGPVTLDNPLVTSVLPTDKTAVAPRDNAITPRDNAVIPSDKTAVTPTDKTALILSEAKDLRISAPAPTDKTAVILSEAKDLRISAPAHAPAANPTHAQVTLEFTATNHTAKPFTGTVRGTFGDVPFTQLLTLAPNETRTVKLNPLHIPNPQLWWPVGYGDPYLYPVDLRLEDHRHQLSHRTSFQAGIREMTATETNGALKLFINGRRFIARGGNWGFGESMLRFRAREYDACVRYHREMNFTMIRNWVGQVPDDAFFEACDRHGIVVWQDFWLANPWDGPIPEDNALFLANARDFLLRIRRHPSIGLYCGRNEWYPPAALQAGLKKLLAELHPGIHYIGSSADGPVSGHGPYRALAIPEYFRLADTKLHSEIGAPAIPPIESIRDMMPPSAIWPQSLDWGLHDFTMIGAQGGTAFRTLVNEAYGGATDGEDWIKLGEIVSYEAYRAMFEAQSRYRMGVLLWMSHPCWPSFVWQTYDFYLQPTAAYFACKLGSEPLHIQWNSLEETIEVVNYSAGLQPGLTARVEVLDADGATAWQKSAGLDSPEDSTQTPIRMQYPANLSAVHFLRLTLTDAEGKLCSTNFYLRGREQDDYTAIRALPPAHVEAETTATQDAAGRWLLTTRLHNTSRSPALFVRPQAIRERTRDRITPAIYSEGYIALIPDETRTVTTELNAADARGERPAILLHGLNLARA